MHKAHPPTLWTQQVEALGLALLNRQGLREQGERGEEGGGAQRWMHGLGSEQLPLQLGGGILGVLPAPPPLPSPRHECRKTTPSPTRARSVCVSSHLQLLHRGGVCVWLTLGVVPEVNEEAGEGAVGLLHERVSAPGGGGVGE